MIKEAIILLTVFTTGFLLGRRSNKKRSKIKTDDIHNIVNGISQKENLAALYKSLIKKVHPDKNPDNLELSKKYTALINNNRRNYRELLSLENKINSINWNRNNLN